MRPSVVPAVCFSSRGVPAVVIPARTLKRRRQDRKKKQTEKIAKQKLVIAPRSSLCHRGGCLCGPKKSTSTTVFATRRSPRTETRENEIVCVRWNAHVPRRQKGPPRRDAIYSIQEIINKLYRALAPPVEARKTKTMPADLPCAQSALTYFYLVGRCVRLVLAVYHVPLSTRHVACLLFRSNDPKEDEEEEGLKKSRFVEYE